MQVDKESNFIKISMEVSNFKTFGHLDNKSITLTYNSMYVTAFTYNKGNKYLIINP